MFTAARLRLASASDRPGSGCSSWVSRSRESRCVRMFGRIFWRFSITVVCCPLEEVPFILSTCGSQWVYIKTSTLASTPCLQQQNFKLRYRMNLFKKHCWSRSSVLKTLCPQATCLSLLKNQIFSNSDVLSYIRSLFATLLCWLTVLLANCFAG